jgi:hypothetical protein
MMNVDHVVARQSSRAQVFPTLDERIRTRTRARVAYQAEHRDAIPARLAALDREWDVERWLQLNSAMLSLAGVALALARGRRWLRLPAVVQLFLLQHGVQGFCPPLAVLRWLGVRTVSEIEAERAALRVLRGEVPGRADGAARGPGERDGSSRGGAVAPTPARVPSNTSARSSERIRRRMEERLALCRLDPAFRERRLKELDREWDVERVIQVEGPLTTLLGLFLAARRGAPWLAVPAFTQGMMVLHAVQGFYPMLPLLRRVGLRTEQEISAERYEIKGMRGDFPSRSGEEAVGADEALEAAQPRGTSAAGRRSR